MTTASSETTLSGARDEPLIVFYNIMRLCEFRGARPNARATLSAAQFTAAMDANHHVQINAERSADDIRGASHLVIIQFSALRSIDTSSQKFKPFIDKIIKTRPRDGVEFNLILITTAPVSPAIARIIADQRDPGVIVEQHTAARFLIVAPEHIAVPRHTIVPRDEVDTLCREMHLILGNLPHMVASGTMPDPMAVWMGLRPGMIVRIDRISETAGNETIYRRCI